MRTLLFQRVRTHRVMLVNIGSLIGTTAATSVLGFVYWWLAARQFSPEAVGLASAAISAMTLLGTICILGLGTLLMGELSRQSGNEASLISTALILVGGIGGCVGIVFAVVAPLLSTDFQLLRASFQNIALFAAGVSLTAITLVLDDALIGLLRGELQLWRNVLFAAAKLMALIAAVLWLSHITGLTIYTTWIVGSALSLVALAGYAISKREGPRRTYLPQWGLLRKLSLVALKHHMLNLTLQGPDQILPMLVIIMLSATTNAWFYVSVKIASFALIIPVALTVVLYAATSAQPATLTHKIRLTLSLACIGSVLANGLLLLCTKQILGLFGQGYAEQAVWCLRILGFGAFPITIRNHYVAVCRIQGQVGRAMLPMIMSGLFELGGAVLGARFGGLTGLSIGWVSAQCVVAMFMCPTVYRAVRSLDTSTRKPVRQDYIEVEEELAAKS